MKTQVADKRITIIAGPNGAGKTTFAPEYLSGDVGCPIFVNADLIAASLSPFHPVDTLFHAGRLMLEEIKDHARAGRSFAFETTLAGKGYIRMIRQWRADNYAVKLVFLSLVTPEEAIDRVRKRIRQGGHAVPETVIRHRFHAGIKNFREIYCQCVDNWEYYDVSGTEPVFLENGDNDERAR